jgi:hypothetical protein
VKFLRHLAWPIALLPALAAFVWTSFASRLPESEVARRALGEVTMRWDFADLVNLRAEPAHVITRAVHLAALHVPGSSLWWVASVNAVLALLLAFALVGVARRTFVLEGMAWPFSIGLAGLLVGSPAFGADWLYGERIGLFLVPLFLLWSLVLLLGASGFTWRALLALLLATAAPFCHTNGLLVFVALAPALLDAARRTSSNRRIGWMFALLICGNVAAVAAMTSAGGLALGDTGLLGRLVEGPSATLLQLLRTTGSAWLDPVPMATWDELALGAFAWAFPLLFWRLGDRSEAARRQAAPWWGCVWFGLSLFLLAAERHGGGLPDDALREVTFGAFLLPVGCIGVLAARFGFGTASVGAGVLLVLAAQDWHRGIEDLRLARMHVERTAMKLQLPTANSVDPVHVDAELQQLQARGWAPNAAGSFADALQQVASAPLDEQLGGVLDGDATSLRGIVRSSLSGDNVQCVVATIVGSEKVLGMVQPDFARQGRNVPWTITWDGPLDAGARVRVAGYCLRRGAFVSLAKTRVLQAGKLVVEPGG